VRRAARIKRIVPLFTLACVAGSLLAGAVAFLAADALKPYWAVFNVLSVIMAIWAAGFVREADAPPGAERTS